MPHTAKLIKSVKNHPILYDIAHKDNRNNRKKNIVWKEIGKELNEDDEKLKKKWRNLRDTYAKYLRCTKTETGKCANKSYKNWQWAPLMESFRPFMTFADTISNIPLEHDEFSTNKSVHQEEPVENEMASELVCEALLDDGSVSNGSTEDCTCRNFNTRIQKHPQTSTKNKRKAPNDTSTDPIDIIFWGYSQTLKQFSPKRQAKIKIQIATIMAEQEMEHQEERRMLQSNQSTRSSCPSFSDPQSPSSIRNEIYGFKEELN